MTFEELVSQLEDDDPSARAAALRGLGALGDRRALEPLTTHLVDHESAVRAAAASGLGALGDREAIRPLWDAFRRDPDPAVQAVAAKALVPILEAVVLDPKANSRRLFIRQLRQLGFETGDQNVVPALQAALSSPDSDVAKTALEALRHLRESPTTAALMERLRSPYDFVVQAALDRLAETGDQSVIPTLLDLMDERRDAAPVWRLIEVVRAIAQRCGDATRAALVECLGDTSPRQRATIMTLAERGEVWALESLAHVLQSSAVPDARREAQRAVETILDYPVFWSTENRRAGEAKHTERLRTYLASGSSGVRAAAAKHIAQVVSALQDVKDILADVREDPIVRVAAVEGLQAMDDPGAYEPLHRALEDFDPAVREAARYALQNARNFEVHYKGRAAIVASNVANADPDVIMTTVGNEDHPRGLRAMFVKELRKAPGRIDREKLTKTLSGVLDRSYDWAEEELADLVLIHQSILALGELGTVSAIQSLLDYADCGECPDQVGVWEALSRILERDRDKGFQEIVGVLREGRLLPSTAKLLAAVGDLRAVPLLEPFAKRVGYMSPRLDEFVKAAREAVARLEPLKTADRLAQMLQTLDPSDSEDAEARWWAAAALAEQGDARGRVVLESALRDPATDAATHARAAELLARLGDGRSA